MSIYSDVALGHESGQKRELLQSRGSSSSVDHLQRSNSGEQEGSEDARVCATSD